MWDLPHLLKLFESNKACLFLLISNVLGMCRGVHVQSHASNAEAFVALTNLLEQTLLMSLPERAELVLTALKADIKINFTMVFSRLHNFKQTHDKVTWGDLPILN